MAKSKKRAETLRRKRQAKKSNMDGGGTSRYAKKTKGHIKPDYRIEGGLLLTRSELRLYRMPEPYIVTTKLVDARTYTVREDAPNTETPA